METAEAMGQRRREWTALVRALQAAEAQGMLGEFTLTFGELRAAGDGVEEAVRCALREWDI